MDRPPVPRTRKEIRHALRGIGVRPSRRLGQNFLADPGALDRIAAASGAGPGDLVLEIGAGLGGLTASLLATGASVLAVEIDPGLCSFLRAAFEGEPRVRILEGDALDGRGGLSPALAEALNPGLSQAEALILGLSQGPSGARAAGLSPVLPFERQVQTGDSPRRLASLDDGDSPRRLSQAEALNPGLSQAEALNPGLSQGPSGARAAGLSPVLPVEGKTQTGDSPRRLASLDDGDSPRRLPRRFLVVANLPYSVATPAIAALLRREPPPADMVVLVQREVGDRIRAAAGADAYGPLSVLVQAVARTARVEAVRKESFHPVPEVASTVIRVTPDPALRAAAGDLARLEALVHAAFSMRRKTLGNALGKSGIPADAVRAAGVDPSRRAEALSPAEFVALAGAL